MHIILGSDSLHPPLTGIGRYAFELASGLLATAQVTSLQGYDLGKFHSLADRVAALEQENAAGEGDISPGRSLALRRYLATLRPVTLAFNQSLALLSRLQRSRFSNALYHSPNYHLPNITSPSVTTVHDLTHLLFPECHPPARVAWMNRTVPDAVRRSSHIICVSAATRDDLVREFGVSEAKVSVVYPGVNSEYRPHTAEACGAMLAAHQLQAGRYFLAVSTLEPRKNLERLLDAYLALDAGLRAHYPLVVAGGDGWGSSVLKQRLARAVPQGVRRLGYVSEHELPMLYSAALCLVYPSLYEGFGLPVLEAQACGLPVIVSDISSLPEVANSQALMINPLEPATITRAMQQSVDDPQWRAACRTAGLAQAKRFTWAQCVDGTLAVYRNVLAGQA